MAKTTTFGVLHLASSFGVTYALTGSTSVAGIVAFVEPVVNTVMHYFLDKYWDAPRGKKLRAAVARMARMLPAATVGRGRATGVTAQVGGSEA